MESNAKAIADDCAKLRADFKEWQERETLKIISCTWACPDGIEAMWEHLK